MKSYYAVAEQSHNHYLVDIGDDAIGNEPLIPIPILPIPVQDCIDKNSRAMKSRVERTSFHIFHHHVAVYE
jgi:hypothetical protein